MAPIENDGSRAARTRPGPLSAATLSGGAWASTRASLRVASSEPETAQPRRASPAGPAGSCSRATSAPMIRTAPLAMARPTSGASSSSRVSCATALTAACLSRPARTSCSMTRPAPAEQMSHSTASRISERG